MLSVHSWTLHWMLHLLHGHVGIFRRNGNDGVQVHWCWRTRQTRMCVGGKNLKMCRFEALPRVQFLKDNQPVEFFLSLQQLEVLLKLKVVFFFQSCEYCIKKTKLL